MFTAAMLYCGATAYTRSSAAMMSDVKAPRHGATPPQLTGSMMFENTCTAIRCALFATPENGWPAGVPSPAAMPATCVPCRQSSSGQGAADPGPISSLRPCGQNDSLSPGDWLE